MINTEKATKYCRGVEHSRSKSVIQLTKYGQYIREWSASREVERELGINNSNIIKCCRGKLNFTGGFKWVYSSDYYRRTISDIKPLF